jgi:hypothetical protein
VRLTPANSTEKDQPKTPLETLLEVEKQLPPSEGWICTYITATCGVRMWHPERGARMCWVNGRKKRLRVIRTTSKFANLSY